MATVAVVTLLLYGLAGHGVHHLSVDGATAGALVGLCLLLVTVFVSSPARRPQTDNERSLEELPASTIAWPQHPLVDLRARASPSTLQSFRN